MVWPRSIFFLRTEQTQIVEHHSIDDDDDDDDDDEEEKEEREEDKEEEEEEEVDDDDDDQKLYNKIITEEVNFPKDLSLAAVLVSKVSLITVKREALKCHSLSYAFECNLPYLVLNLQELYQFPQCCMCFVQFIK